MADPPIFELGTMEILNTSVHLPLSLTFRGWFGASGALTVSAGITLVYSLGAALHWSTVCIVCGAIPLAVAAAMTLLPETPNWLANNGRREEAQKASTKTGGKFKRRKDTMCTRVYPFGGQRGGNWQLARVRDPLPALSLFE